MTNQFCVALGHDRVSLCGALAGSSKTLTVQAVCTIVPHRLLRAAIINEGNVPVADPIRGLKTSTGGPQQADSFKCRKLQIDDNLDLCVLTNAFVVCSQPVGFNGEHDIGLDRTSVRREASREKPVHDHAGDVIPTSSVVGDLGKSAKAAERWPSKPTGGRVIGDGSQLDDK